MVHQRPPKKPRHAEGETGTEAHGGFDPYRAWLDVREVRRPLNAYELLGIRTLEDDQEAIRAAASRKRAALLAHRPAAPPEIWNQVYSELEQAAQTLLDADRKQAYDTALKEGQSLGAGSGAATPSDGCGPRLRCAACGASNYATFKFCTQCGASLWEPCPLCGTVSPAAEKFCGACGCNLVEELQKQQAQFEADLQTALAMQAEGRFEEALNLLHKIAEADHPRLKQYAARASEAVKQTASLRQKLTVEAEQRFQQAQACMEKQDYAEAVKLLEAIPQALRSPAVQHLHADAASRAQQVQDLEQQLAALAEGGPLRDVLATVDHLLALRANHPSALQAAETIQERLVQAARKKMAAYDYETALQLLNRVPEAARTEQARQLLQQLEELAWLSADLRRSPVIDPILPSVAKRLHELAPDNPLAVRALAEIQKRLQRHQEQPRSGLPRWASPPNQYYVGFPVDRLTGFKRITYPPELAPQLLDAHPGCFFVACGLALQGLGQAAIRTNLLPPETRRFFDFIRRPIRLGTARTAWGIDIGSSSLKAARLSWDGRNNTARVEALEHLPHRKLLGQAANSIEEEAIVEETVRAFLDRHKLKGDCVVLGVPSRLVLQRRLTVPVADKKKLQQIVEFEAKRNLPFRLVEMTWDYQSLGEAAEQPELVAAADAVGRQGQAGKSSGSRRRAVKPQPKQDVLLVAAKKVAVTRRLERLRELGIYPDLVQCDSLSLYNFWLHEYGANPEADGDFSAQKSPEDLDGSALPSGSKSLVVLLDIGNDSTNIVLCSPGIVWYRTSNLGSFSFARALVQQFKLTLGQADQWLRNPLKSPQPAAMYATLETQFENLVQEVQQTIELFHKDTHQHRVARMLLCGGGACLHGLLRYLWFGS